MMARATRITAEFCAVCIPLVMVVLAFCMWGRG